MSLAANAKAFAKEYVVLVEALMQEGVDEVTARAEARATALCIVMVDQEVTPCPTCGSTQ